MNAWTETMTEVMRLAGFNVSSWDVRALLPGAGFWGIAALFVALCLLCAWHDARLNRQDHEPGVDRG